MSPSVFSSPLHTDSLTVGVTITIAVVAENFSVPGNMKITDSND